VTRKADFGEIADQTIWLDHDGTRAQNAPLSDMIWSVPEIIADLSRLYTLLPGDLIMTGTPAGVGAVKPGSVLKGGIDGLVPASTVWCRCRSQSARMDNNHAPRKCDAPPN